MFVSGLLYTLTAAVASNSAATRAGGAVWTGTWASQSATVSFDWWVLRHCVVTGASRRDMRMTVGQPDALLYMS